MFRRRSYGAVGRSALAGALFLSVAGSAGPRGEVVPGPVEARVVAVVDGDTLVVSARIWLGQRIETHVRIDGVDAPELRGRCRGERDLARAARTFVATRIGGEPVVLSDVRFGKYAGRVVARVETAAGEDLAEVLIAAGLARRYDGRARRPWC